MESILSNYPSLKGKIYANTATQGLMAPLVHIYRKSYHPLETTDSDKSGLKTPTINVLKQTLGLYLGTDSKNIALVPNFSIGLNLLLEGLDSSERILLLQNDYPSLNWPFYGRFYQINHLPITPNIESQIVDVIRAKKITVFAFSRVQWLDGFKLREQFLNTLKQAFPDLLLVVDGTQWVGTEEVGFDQRPYDILGASGYKWLGAGYGNGFILQKPEVRQRFKLKSRGFGSSRHQQYAWDNLQFFPHLEPGHLDNFAFGSLYYALQEIENYGKAKRNEEIGTLAHYVYEKLSVFSNRTSCSDKYSDVSTIISIPSISGRFEQLVANGVVCVKRGDAIRLSFHYYNTHKEVDNIEKLLQ